MKRAISLALVASLAAVGLSACGVEPQVASQDDESAGQVVESDSSTAGEELTLTREVAPLELSTDTVKDNSCLGDGTSVDFAWFDVAWKANQDLDSMEFELVTSRGVEQVGGPLTVPPVNFGGRIDYSGAAIWGEHTEVLRNASFVSGNQTETVDGLTPIEDQTGLLVFHLRLDPETARTTGGRIDGVKASYTTSQGSRGELEIPTNVTLNLGSCT